MPQYSATMVSHSFWFHEFSQYLSLREQGNSDADIRNLAVTENYFQQQSNARALRMFQTLKRRINVLDEDYFDLFFSLDLANQKLMNLSASLQLDPLFDDFLYDLYRNELILGDAKLYPYEVDAFFHQKQIENPKVATWTEQTVKRLANTFKVFFREAGLLENQGDYDLVKQPLLDTRLEVLMHTKGLTRQLSAFLGR